MEYDGSWLECLGRNSTTTTTTTTIFVGRESSGDYAQETMDLSQLTTTSVRLAKGARTCNKEASAGQYEYEYLSGSTLWVARASIGT